MLRWIALFVLLPPVELALLLWIGSALGPLPTFLLVVVTGVVGATFARREGFAVLRQLSRDAATGLPPAERLVEGAMIVVGGLLLLTPGVLTDVVGLSLVLPWTRRLLAPHLLARLLRLVATGGLHVQVGGRVLSPRPGPRSGPGPGPHGDPPGGASPGRDPASRDDRTSPFDHPVA